MRLSAPALTFGLALCLALPGLADTACETVPGNIVQNCGFEDGTYTATYVFPTISDSGVPNSWDPNGPFIESYEFGLDYVATDPATTNDYLLFGSTTLVGSDAALSQNLTDVAGVTYDGYVDLSGLQGGAVGPGFSIQIDGGTFISLDDQESFSFVGTGQDDLTLVAALRSGPWDITGVVVTPAVPEPRATFLIPAAMLACFLWRSKRHRISAIP